MFEWKSQDKGGYRSGAGKKITCLATDDKLTQDQKTAIQLSQNAISGQDDPATLKLLYESILDTEMKKYSGLDDKTLELLEKLVQRVLRRPI